MAAAEGFKAVGAESKNEERRVGCSKARREGFFVAEVDVAVGVVGGVKRPRELRANWSLACTFASAAYGSIGRHLDEDDEDEPPPW